MVIYNWKIVRYFNDLFRELFQFQFLFSFLFLFLFEFIYWNLQDVYFLEKHGKHGILYLEKSVNFYGILFIE